MAARVKIFWLPAFQEKRELFFLACISIPPTIVNIQVREHYVCTEGAIQILTNFY